MFRPDELLVLICEVSERFGNLREIFDKMSIIAIQAKKTSDLLHRLRRFPFNNGLNLFGSIAMPLGDMT